MAECVSQTMKCWLWSRLYNHSLNYLRVRVSFFVLDFLWECHTVSSSSVIVVAA